MHVVVCFVFLSPHFALATGFRFIVMPLLHECHCMFCFPLPPFEFANGFRFTAIPSITSNVPVHFTAINQCPTWPVPF